VVIRGTMWALKQRRLEHSNTREGGTLELEITKGSYRRNTLTN
jgi:hypothetical protein